MTFSERYSYGAVVEYADGLEEEHYFENEDDARNFAYASCESGEVVGVDLYIMDWYMHQSTSIDYIQA